MGNGVNKIDESTFYMHRRKDLKEEGIWNNVEKKLLIYLIMNNKSTNFLSL